MDLSAVAGRQREELAEAKRSQGVVIAVVVRVKILPLPERSGGKAAARVKSPSDTKMKAWRHARGRFLACNLLARNTGTKSALMKVSGIDSGEWT
jgi:hypothetical protein